MDLDTDANHGRPRTWENVFHNRKNFFETATGNKETSTLPRRKKDPHLPRRHITEYFQNLSLEPTSSTVSSDAQHTKHTSDETEVKQPPTVLPKQKRNIDFFTVEQQQVRDNPQHYEISSPITSTSSAISTKSPQSTTTATDVTEVKLTPIVKPRRRNTLPSGYVPGKYRDNLQSTHNLHPVIPVSSTVSSNSSQHIATRLTGDENIEETQLYKKEFSEDTHNKNELRGNHDEHVEYAKQEEQTGSRYYGFNQKTEKQDNSIKHNDHEQDVSQTKSTANMIQEENLMKTVEDLQRNLHRREQEIQEQKRISYETSVEMQKWKTSYYHQQCEYTSLKQRKEKNVDPMLNLIAELKQMLLETKTRLYVPLYKLELVTEKLAPLQEQFGHELQLILESKDAIENVQKYAEVSQSYGEMDLSGIDD